jgi:hypothetical protein
VKAFGITAVTPDEIETARKNATDNPYTSERYIPSKFMTVMSRSGESAGQPSKPAMEPPAPKGKMDEMHTQVKNDMTICGYCDGDGGGGGWTLILFNALIFACL